MLRAGKWDVKKNKNNNTTTFCENAGKAKQSQIQCQNQQKTIILESMPNSGQPRNNVETIP